jgi:replicative DNA helicase
MDETTPRNGEAEVALLASCLAYPKRYAKLKDEMLPSQFYFEPHGWAWQAMADIEADGMRISPISLCERLRLAGKLDTFRVFGWSDTFGENAILKLAASGNSDARDIDTMVAIVKATAAKRELLNVANKLAAASMNGKRPNDIIQETYKSLGEIELSTGHASTELLDAKTALTQAYDLATKQASGLGGAINTGLSDLNDYLGGWQKGDYITIAGRPGTGKTSFMLTTALHATMNQSKRVGIFSLEMSSAQLMNRLISQWSTVPGDRIRDGKMSEEQWGKYNDAIEALGVMKISICESATLDMAKIRTFARKMAYSGLDMLIIDYIGLITPDRAENRVQEVSQISRGMKMLARELDIPVLCAAQMNRAIESRAEKRPQLSDLRESGSIEQDSDIVIFTYRPDDNDRAKAVLSIAKHRNGRVGEVNAFFNETTTRFCNAARPA